MLNSKLDKVELHETLNFAFQTFFDNRPTIVCFWVILGQLSLIIQSMWEPSLKYLSRFAVPVVKFPFSS